jgi:hypothetical protein
MKLMECAFSQEDNQLGVRMFADLWNNFVRDVYHHADQALRGVLDDLGRERNSNSLCSWWNVESANHCGVSVGVRVVFARCFFIFATGTR